MSNESDEKWLRQAAEAEDGANPNAGTLLGELRTIAIMAAADPKMRLTQDYIAGWNAALVAVRASLRERANGFYSAGDIEIMDYVDKIVARRDALDGLAKAEYDAGTYEGTPIPEGGSDK